MGKNYDIGKIFDVLLAFSGEMRFEELLNIILSKMMEITDSDAGTLYILEDNKLHFRIIKNRTLNIFQSADDFIELPPIVLDKENIENVSAYTAIKNEIVLIDDVYESERFNFSGPKNYDKITGYRTRSMLVIPLSTYVNDKLETIGVIQLLNTVDAKTGEFVPYGDIFSPPVIPALANVAGNTLANLMHLREIRTLFQSFVSALVGAIDERSKYNSNHTQKVTSLCDAFARYLSSYFPKDHPYYFGERRLEELTMAAMLHDIGKIVTPIHIMDKADRLGERLHVVRNRFELKKLQLEIDFLKGCITKEEYISADGVLQDARDLVESSAIAEFLTDEKIYEIKKLSKLTYKNPQGETAPLLDPEDIDSLSVQKGTLTDLERRIMQEHVSVTDRILKNIAFRKYYKNVPMWAGSHHEFLDGSGYPNGLKGSQIPIEVCIITIMDIFEALTAADRPYKKPLPTDKALAILMEMVKDGKLHGEMVRLFIESRIWLEVASNWKEASQVSSFHEYFQI